MFGAKAAKCLPMIDGLSDTNPSLLLKKINMANEGYHEAMLELADKA